MSAHLRYSGGGGSVVCRIKTNCLTLGLACWYLIISVTENGDLSSAEDVRAVEEELEACIIEQTGKMRGTFSRAAIA